MSILPWERPCRVILDKLGEREPCRDCGFCWMSQEQVFEILMIVVPIIDVNEDKPMIK